MDALDGSSGYAYISSDCDVARIASADSAGFVAGLGDRVILDEVQRVPSLFTALKQDIDRNRTPDRVLTGPPKPKPRWDVHMAGDGDLDWGYAGTPLPLIAGWSGSGA